MSEAGKGGGTVSLQRDVFAYLTLDERELKRSGLRLIDWAAACGADGVIIPQLQQADPGLMECFIERARASTLHCYVEETSVPTAAGVDGYYVDAPDEQSLAMLGKLGRAILRVQSVKQARAYLKNLSEVSFLYVDDGQPSGAWLELCQALKRTWGQLPGYLDDTPGFTNALERSAYAPLVVKRLALSRSRAGSAQQGTLLPYEFSTLVQVVRGIREQLAVLNANRLAEVTGRRPTDQHRGAEVQRAIPGRGPADIAVVIRSKNEARWIGQALTKIAEQSRQPKEIILVDNESTDGTVDIARSFAGRLPLQMVTIRDSEFKFSRALNRGIECTTASWVVSLSAHCVPVHAGWLAAFEQETRRSEWSGKRLELLAGIYGRQEPIDGVTSDVDKRDLWTMFGAERRLQGDQDFFFHNANSMIQRSLWEKFRFNEAIHGVEDRDWAKNVLADGHVIVYVPSASVYHHHGIHQGRNEARAKRVVKIIELIQQRAPTGPLTGSSSRTHHHET